MVGGGVSLFDNVAAASTKVVEAAALSLTRVGVNRHSLSFSRFCVIFRFLVDNIYP